MRCSEPRAGEPRQYVLSAVQEPGSADPIKHFIIRYENERYSIDTTTYASVVDLVQTHLRKRTSVSIQVSARGVLGSEGGGGS